MRHVWLFASSFPRAGWGNYDPEVRLFVETCCFFDEKTYLCDKYDSYSACLSRG